MYKVIETEFNKTLVMSEKHYEVFNNSAKCWICTESYEEGEVKAKDQNQWNITGIFVLFDWSTNINLSLSKKHCCCVS